MSREVEVIQVVRTRLLARGQGTEADPIRSVVQYWSLEGDLLAEVDPEDSYSQVRIKDEHL